MAECPRTARNPLYANIAILEASLGKSQMSWIFQTFYLPENIKKHIFPSEYTVYGCVYLHVSPPWINIYLKPSNLVSFISCISTDWHLPHLFKKRRLLSSFILHSRIHCDFSYQYLAPAPLWLQHLNAESLGCAAFFTNYNRKKDCIVWTQFSPAVPSLCQKSGKKKKNPILGVVDSPAFAFVSSPAIGLEMLWW